MYIQKLRIQKLNVNLLIYNNKKNYNFQNNKPHLGIGCDTFGVTCYKLTLTIKIITLIIRVTILSKKNTIMGLRISHDPTHDILCVLSILRLPWILKIFRLKPDIAYPHHCWIAQLFYSGLLFFF